jgi:cytochrome c oxidase subunit 2
LATSPHGGQTDDRNDAAEGDPVTEGTNVVGTSARRLATAVAAIALVATACSEQLPLNTLDPEGPAGRSIDSLLNFVLIIAGFVFLFVNLGVLMVATKYRRRAGDDEFPVQTHGNTKLELGWTIVPALILVVVAAFTVSTLLDLYESKEKEAALVVRVEGQQWWWSYKYDLNGNGSFDDVEDLTTATELVIPAGQKVALKITSNDVIHSFWIPKLNGKKDAVPGRVHDWWLQADEPNKYFLGACTEFCGLSHAYMRMAVVTKTQADFDQWLVDQKTPAAVPLDDPAAMRGLEVFTQQCASCHQIGGVNSTDCVALTPEESQEFEPATFDPETQCYKGIAEGWVQAAQVSGNAPNLTHLMSRKKFIGGLYDLYDENGNPARNTIEAWIRNPQDFKKMAPEATEYSDLGRGMPKLALTEAQLDDLVTYLLTLK